MATSDLAPDGLTRKRFAWLVLGVVAAGGVVALIVSLRSPPQMGADDDVFRTVDALYTAVRSRDEKRLSQCSDRLSAYKADGKLPDGAAEYLDGVVAKARDGRWESAAERLYSFMLAQRREGAAGPVRQAPAGRTPQARAQVGGRN